jgi:hypothetical protein
MRSSSFGGFESVQVSSFVGGHPHFVSWRAFVAANVAGGERGISSGPGKRDERERAMSHGPFLRHTNWASHLLGPPLCSSCHTPPPDRARTSQPTSLWRGEGRV